MACFPGLDWCYLSQSPREACFLQSMAAGHSQEGSSAQQGGLALLWGFEVCRCACCPDIPTGSFCESPERESFKTNHAWFQFAKHPDAARLSSAVLRLGTRGLPARRLQGTALSDQKQERHVVTGEWVTAGRGSGSPPPSHLSQITVPSPGRRQDWPRSHKEEMAETDS